MAQLEHLLAPHVHVRMLLRGPGLAGGGARGGTAREAFGQRGEHREQIDRDRAEGEHAEHGAEHEQLEGVVALLPRDVRGDLVLERLARSDRGVQALDERLLPRLRAIRQAIIGSSEIIIGHQ